MENLKPAPNIQLASIAGFLSVGILHICQANGIIIPPDVASSLPAFIVAIVAWAHDYFSNSTLRAK